MTTSTLLTGRLWTQPDLERALAGGGGWEREVLTAFEAAIADEDFPCFFARAAHRKQTLCFGFLDHADDQAAAEIVCRYLDRLDESNGPEEAFQVLVIAVRPDGCRDSDALHRRAQAFLDTLVANDPREWPPGAALDERDPAWQFYFRGVPIFVNVNVPAYTQRRSRNLGPSLVFVIQARAVFDVIAGRDAAGVRLREEIRSRIDRFDAIPRSPCLGFYRDGDSREASQFILGDDNDEPIQVTCSRPAGEEGAVHPVRR